MSSLMKTRPSWSRDPAMIAIGVMLAIVAFAMADRAFSIMTFPYDLLFRPWILF